MSTNKVVKKIEEGGMHDLLFQSTRIEGLPLKKEDVEDIYAHGLVPGYGAQNCRFVCNIADAYDFVLENLGVGNELPLLRQLNKICGDHLIFGAGDLRKMDTGIVGTDWKPDIPDYDVVVDGLARLSEIADPIYRAMALFCFVARGQFFNDGNKRLAQLIMNKVLIESEVGYLHIAEENTNLFMRLLVEYYETCDPNRIFNFLKKCIKTV